MEGDVWAWRDLMKYVCGLLAGSVSGLLPALRGACIEPGLRRRLTMAVKILRGLAVTGACG